MSDDHDLQQRATAEARAQTEAIEQARATTPNTVMTSADGEVEVELRADLAVERVTLRATATRDRQQLEDSLVEVFTAAIKAARDSDPALRMAQARMGTEVDSVLTQMDRLQSDLKARSEQAQAKMEQLKAAIDARRASGRQFRIN